MDNWFIFADYLDSEKIVCVDNKFNIMVLDQNFEIIKRLSLLDNAHLFNLKEQFLDQ